MSTQTATLKMEAAGLCNVCAKTTWSHISKEHNLNFHCHEKTKSHIKYILD